MIDDSDIVTHSDPVARDRCNYIARVSLAQDGMPGKFEQMWARTDDQKTFELCCVPFFTYGLSLGDTFSVINADGDYRVQKMSGHRTIRFAIQDDEFAHRQHEELHGALAQTGAAMEFLGHANGYGALDLADGSQADGVIAVLQPLFERGVLMWEWADPAVD